MDNLIFVQVVDGAEHLPDGLRSILLRELALLADTVKQLTAGGELGDDVELVAGLKPVDELDNVGVLEPLEHLELVVYHLLVPLDILLEDDLDGDLAGRALGLADDTVGTGAEGSTESVFGSAVRLLSIF